MTEIPWFQLKVQHLRFGLFSAPFFINYSLNKNTQETVKKKPHPLLVCCHLNILVSD